MRNKKLLELVDYERQNYQNNVFYSKNMITAWLKNEAPYRIWKWQRLSRFTDYYRSLMYNGVGLSRHLAKILYIIYIRRKQKLGEKLGLEIGTENIGCGLVIYHYNNVINACAIIGKNCHLHGSNVIGNNGKSLDAPIIGDNVMLGAGSKVLGPVTIADNIKIAAGAIVVHSFLESGITIAGIPAKKVDKKRQMSI